MSVRGRTVGLHGDLVIEHCSFILRAFNLHCLWYRTLLSILCNGKHIKHLAVSMQLRATTVCW